MKNSKSLLITLGHNSSAIFINGEDTIGYEQERLSGIKADSQFPIDAINEIIYNVGIKNFAGCTAYVSHWFDHTPSIDKFDDDYKFTPSKYMSQKDYDFLKTLCSYVTFVNSHFTHHDAHAWSAMSFFNYFYDKDKNKLAKTTAKQLYTIVADGFGTNQEVVSIYESRYENDRAPRLIHRVFGYEASLGLMYQYATSFCGMKENQDEYKFLGYEAHVLEYFNTHEIDVLHTHVHEITKTLLSLAETNTKVIYGQSGTIDTDKLAKVKNQWHSTFAEVVRSIDIDMDDTFKLRVAIAYVIQNVIETYFLALTRMYGMQNVVCVGGCFYNVKLNNAILEGTDGLFCVMPLAGDQGAAIGMYHRCTGKQFPFNTLAIGKRRLFNIVKSLPKNAVYRRINGSNMSDIAHNIATLISNGNIVNLIYGNMEFGPRALCNTSSLMLPTAENVANNNRMNNRNEVMPCAPVCSTEFVNCLFDEYELSRVVGSDQFMICTHTYMKEFSAQYAGVMHKKPLSVFDEHTGRPQIVQPDTLIGLILKFVNDICDAKCIVNTSFNAHGRPIAFDTTEILQNFEYQCEHAADGEEPILYVVETSDDCE